jgi:large subunit ribosomal protein L23
MNQERLYQVLLAPHVSEKAAVNADAGLHTFRVATDANKLEVKKAVEQLFSVKVESVRMVRVKGKNKRFGQRFGRRSDWKKAVVRLSEGSDIDYASMGG